MEILGETNFGQDTIQPIQCPLRDRHSSSEWEKGWSREVPSSPQVFLAKGLVSSFRNYSCKICFKIYLNVEHRCNFLVSDLQAIHGWDSYSIHKQVIGSAGAQVTDCQHL